MSCMDVLVGLDEMGAQDGREELGRVDGVLLGHYVGRILHRVCCDHDAVVGFGVSRLSQ